MSNHGSHVTPRFLCVKFWFAVAFMAAASAVPAVTLTIRPSLPLITVGTHLPLQVEVRDAAALPIAPVNTAWSVTPGSGEAVISPNGVLTGVRPGELTVTVQSNGAVLATTAHVVPSTEDILISTPEVEGAAAETLFVPVILSSSPAITAAAFTILFASEDPTALPVIPSEITPPEGGSLVLSGAVAQGFRVEVAWPNPVAGPVVLANLKVNAPSGTAKDTLYRILLVQGEVTDTTNRRLSVVATPGSLLVRISRPGPVSQLRVIPDRATLYAGETLRFFARAFDANGNRVVGFNRSWSLSDGSLGFIDENGVYEAMEAGVALAQLASGALTAEAAITVLPGPAPKPDHLILPIVDAKAGDTVSVPLLLAGVDGLGGLSLKVRATSLNGAPALRFLEPITGPLAVASFLGSNLLSDGRQSIALLASRDISGPGILAYLRFEVPIEATGQSRYTLEIVDPDLSDGRGQIIPVAGAIGGIVVSADVTPPTVNWTGLRSGEIISGSIQVGAAAEDDQSVSRVELLVDGRVVDGRSNSPFLLSWDTTASTNGSRVVQLRAVDPSGNIGVSSQIAVVVDNLPPVAVIETPKAGEAVKGRLVVTGSASDINFLEYRLHAAPAPSPSATIDLSGARSVPVSRGTLAEWDTTTVADGDYDLILTVRDRAGNEGTAFVRARVVNTPPGLRFVETNGVAVKGAATFTVEPTGGELTSVAFTLDGGSPTLFTLPPYRLSVPTSALSNGTHALRAVGTDPTGASVEVSLEFVVDNSPPELAVVKPVSSSRVSTLVPIEVTLRDTTSTTLEMSYGAGATPTRFTTIRSLTIPPGTSPEVVVWDTSALPEGPYTLRLVGMDAVGQGVERRVPVTVDHGPPALVVRSPVANAWVPGNLTLEAEAADPGGIAGFTVMMDGEKVGEGDRSPYRVTMDLSGHDEGEHRLTVMVTDRAGNTADSEILFRIDRTAPTARLTTPSALDTVNGDVTVRGDASDAPPGELALYRVEIGAGDAPSVWQPVATGTAARIDGVLGEFNASGLPTGPYTVRLVVTDRAGNVSMATVPVLVGEVVRVGDANNDGRINVADATLVLRAAVGLVTLSPRQFAAADIIADGRINLNDATRILRIAVGLATG